MQYIQMYPLFELSAEVQAELYPILLFFGMFFVVFGLGGSLIRRLPHKPGSMLDEILNEDALLESEKYACIRSFLDQNTANFIDFGTI